MSGRIVALGEIMLRLKPPGFERFFQSPMLEVIFGGSEANTAVSLAHLGLDVAFITALPDNPIGDGCIRFLRGFGVDSSLILRQGERMGIYFLEQGANQRPSSVVYDRAHSAISTAQAADFDWDGIFADAAWFHFTGITPAISARAAQLTLTAVQEASQRGITISCDYNYRNKLWQYGQTASDVMRELVKYVNVLIANGRDCAGMLGWQQEAETQQEVVEAMFNAFPNLTYQAMTMRNSVSASHNGYAAALFNGRELLRSHYYDITHIVDRVGGGDAFAAGLIYGLHTGMGDEAALNFGVAASCLKHSIPGDVNLATVAEIQQLVDGNSSGRVQR